MARLTVPVTRTIWPSRKSDILQRIEGLRPYSEPMLLGGIWGALCILAENVDRINNEPMYGPMIDDEE